MEVLNDILGYKDRKIYQNSDYFKFSLDSIMLSNFATIRLRDRHILDLGTGNGVIPLILSLRTTKFIDGVEIQKELYDLACKSISYNNLDSQISLYNEDMKKFINSSTIEKYDLITCNPPYFKVSDGNNLNTNIQKMIARHEVVIDLDGIFYTASKLLKNNGNLSIVHRTERLNEILFLFKKYNIEPKRIQFVHENINSESTLVLIEGQKNAKSGMKILPPFILYDETGNMTDKYYKINNEVIK